MPWGNPQPEAKKSDVPNFDTVVCLLDLFFSSNPIPPEAKDKIQILFYDDKKLAVDSVFQSQSSVLFCHGNRWFRICNNGTNWVVLLSCLLLEDDYTNHASAVLLQYLDVVLTWICSTNFSSVFCSKHYVFLGDVILINWLWVVVHCQTWFDCRGVSSHHIDVLSLRTWKQCLLGVLMLIGFFYFIIHQSKKRDSHTPAPSGKQDLAKAKFDVHSCISKPTYCRHPFFLQTEVIVMTALDVQPWELEWLRSGHDVFPKGRKWIEGGKSQPASFHCLWNNTGDVPLKATKATHSSF